MEYAIIILLKEKELIDNCLSKSDWVNYKEAKARQEKKSKHLKNAINKLKCL